MAKLFVDDQEAKGTRSAVGDTDSGSVMGNYVAKLSPGKHTFEVKYKTPGAQGFDANGGTWQTRSMSVVVLGAEHTYETFTCGDEVALDTSELLSGSGLGLGGGWTDYGHSYQGASIYKQGDFCMVSGLVKTSSWGAIAELPDNCRPTGRLAFNLNNNEYQSQVDVLPNGQVLWMAGGKSHGWLSLSGIAFSTTAGTPLATASG
jgi:hypothetical protein